MTQSLRRRPRLRTVARQCREQSLRRFQRDAFGIIEPGRQYLSNWHIDAICTHLEALSRGEIKRLLINMPPRHMKSTLCSVMLPAWIWTTQPWVRFIYASYDLKLARRDNLKTRDVVQSDWYQDQWGSTVKIDSHQDTKENFRNTQHGYRMCTSIGGGLTGEGADIFGIDDPHNVLSALTSQAERDRAIMWFDEAASSRLNPGTHLGCVVVVMQRIHENDLSGHILSAESRDDWEHLVLPARYDPAFTTTTALGWTDPRTVDGDLLWPEAYPEKQVASLEKRMGTYSAAAQLGQRPSPRGGGILKSDSFVMVPKHEWPRFQQYDETLQSWDLTFGSAHQKASYNVCLVLGRIGANVYVEAMPVNDRMEFPEQLAALIAVSQLFPKTLTRLVEDAANAKAAKTMLRKRVPGILLTPKEGSKISVARSWSPILASGNIHLKDWDPASEVIRQQVESFPNGASDDIVDALGQGLLHWFGGDVPVTVFDLTALEGHEQQSKWLREVI